MANLSKLLGIEGAAADVIDGLNAALDSAGEVPAAIVAAWLDHSAAVKALDGESRAKAWAQVEAAWKVAGGAGDLAAAVKTEIEKRKSSEAK